MPKNPPPPVRKKKLKPYAPDVRAMKVDGYLWIPGAKQKVVKVLTSVLSKKLDRTYLTKAHPEGVEVWRTK